MSRGKGETGQRCEKDEGWVPAVVFETQGDSGAVDGARRRSSHDLSEYSVSPIVSISIAWGKRE